MNFGIYGNLVLRNFIFLLASLEIDPNIQGGPKKVSHYRESSLNCIKNRQPG